MLIQPLLLTGCHLGSASTAGRNALAPSSHSQPSINSGKALFRLDLQIGFFPFTVNLSRRFFFFFCFFYPILEGKSAQCTGCSKAARTQAAALHPPTANTSGTQMTLTPCTGMDEGVSTPCRSQTLSFSAKSTGPGCGSG